MCIRITLPMWKFGSELFWGFPSRKQIYKVPGLKVAFTHHGHAGWQGFDLSVKTEALYSNLRTGVYLAKLQLWWGTISSVWNVVTDANPASQGSQANPGFPAPRQDPQSPPETDLSVGFLYKGFSILEQNPAIQSPEVPQMCWSGHSAKATS